MKNRRPVFFNLTQIQMPVGSLTSIAHRITGMLLALGIPFTIYLLELSLQGQQGYAKVIGMFDKLAFKGLAILFIWALAHHLLAGLRHLLSDIDVGSHLHAARTSVWIINCSAAAIALLSAGAFFFEKSAFRIACVGSATFRRRLHVFVPWIRASPFHIRASAFL